MLCRRSAPLREVRFARLRSKSRSVAPAKAFSGPHAAKKTGANGPRSNNDKRRMVTRRTNRTRTVNKDSGRAEEFEKFSFALDEAFSPAFSGGGKRL
jgi:hypothetical protein